MGQKINPNSFRLGITKPWPVRWFTKGSYRHFLEEDEIIRKEIREKISPAGIIGIEIERMNNNCKVIIKVARAGLVIGRGGKGIEDLTKAIQGALKKLKAKRIAKGRAKEKTNLSINVEELKKTEISAVYVAQQIAWDIEKRLPFRKTMKKYLEKIMQSREIKGAKILFSGRLDGSEIARREWLRKGELPLQKLRADIDYGQAVAHCTYGTIGIKVWIYKGDILEEKSNK